MSVRSCLLCGKALSRIWVGSGEDFCSREHRNQYRLRRGMDRLLEAHKVANVMRRRENPRLLAAGRLINGGPREPRAFALPVAAVAAPPAAMGRPQAALALEACRPAAAGPLDLPPRMEALAGCVAHEARAASFPPRTAPPSPMWLRIRVYEPSPQRAPLLPSVVDRVAPAEARRRLQISPWRTVSPVPRGVPASPACPAGQFTCGVWAGSETSPAKPRVVANACKGRALRVALAAGFRIPGWQLRPIAFPAPPLGGIAWPDVRVPCAQLCGPAGTVEMAVLASAMKLAPPALRIPAAPPAGFPGSFRWPGTLGIPRVFANPSVTRRLTVVPFGYSEESPGKERPHEYCN